MKTILLLLAAFGCASFATAADPIVVVTSSNAVLVDGVNSGQVCDTIRNRPELASAIQRALVAYDTTQKEALAIIAADAVKSETARKDALAAIKTALANGTPAERLAAVEAAHAKHSMTDRQRALKAAREAKAAAEAAIIEAQKP